MSQRTGNNNPVKELEIFAMASDPIYIGTGGYTIGRVDNTIVRDPITNVPKIPGSSLAGTWRYYVVLEVHKYFSNDKFKINKSERKNKLNEFLRSKGKSIWSALDSNERKEFMKQIFNIEDSNNKKWILFEGNRFIGIKCAGQDEAPDKYFEDLNDSVENTGHCGHCIVCKGFGFSKKDISWQGMLFFSDLEIILFPVFTIKGTKWITTASKLRKTGIDESKPTDKKIRIHNSEEDISHLNLGWLYLEVDTSKHNISLTNDISEFGSFKLEPKDIIIVPEDLFPHIVNSNLEVRTSVSIDPITGAAKEGALFTSEAIPRGTIFYGNIRIFDKKSFGEIEEKLTPLPEVGDLKNALEDSKHFYETLGIGGMTTRGFGRLVINLQEKKNNSDGGNQDV
ncbi:protein of unknown function DUF324 [Thermovibrio ammonificans HB-1]|uniref:CRISPR type III-associated protein domain-containing protein n=1 Tax=Thermovibrio ammonificans (strain DSM 15698 / JCM 12110 / HB-1) TaxID=648996 RepID=E8T4Q2_THEA1|nr:RAMP superfamily CRISPR-associated protein [Thermovibrio ammonificans]ADU96314.1 protein of unknown function DUF324 [Thermovibrio ammonificans HB-1]